MTILNYTIAAVSTFLFIAVGAWLTQPQPHYNRLQLKHIHTDSVKNYAHMASMDRTWCVEQVE